MAEANIQIVFKVSLAVKKEFAPPDYDGTILDDKLPFEAALTVGLMVNGVEDKQLEACGKFEWIYRLAATLVAESDNNNEQLCEEPTEGKRGTEDQKCSTGSSAATESGGPESDLGKGQVPLDQLNLSHHPTQHGPH